MASMSDWLLGLPFGMAGGALAVLCTICSSFVLSEVILYTV
jgi:hypothetical protein